VPLLLALVFAVAIGMAAGGSVSLLPEIRIKWESLFVLSLVAQGAALPYAGGLGLSRNLIVGLWFLSAVVILAIAVRNRSQMGMLSILAGALLNCVVVAANAGMPVSTRAIRAVDASVEASMRVTGLHVVQTSTTRLCLLADIMPMYTPLGLRTVVSIGDMLLLVGVAVLVISYMVGHMGTEGD
jgi:hypothetical protein